MAISRNVLATGNPRVDGELSGFAWDQNGLPTLTYSFGSAVSGYADVTDYQQANDPAFGQISVQQETAL